ncbi:MAG TPA: Rieske 2Fe-2S domain-containing protein [Bacteroidia bacterium]|nr:Rieske 2Fe-2S domain-containing protein [Bacteroidia bacterium]
MFKTVTRWIFLENDDTGFSLYPSIRYVAGKKIIVVKTQTGIFAMEEKCPHNGFSLAAGMCTEDGEAIVCPLHRYAFDFKTGRCKNGSGGAARVFPIETRDDGIYIGVPETQWGW